ncbi:hypothetical protein EI534_15630 [Pseudomonas frederiksbergensis]|nr:hypothetical protein [Pseudomonas frederiksbergensis]
MERTDYLKLRFDVQRELTSGINSEFLDVDDLVSSVMRIFLRSLSDGEVKRQRASRTLKPSGVTLKSPGTGNRLGDFR